MKKLRDELGDLDRRYYPVAEVVDDRMRRWFNGERVLSLEGKPILSYADIMSQKETPVDETGADVNSTQFERIKHFGL